MENWNNILSWRKKCPYSSNTPSIWGLAAPLRHYLVFHYDPLIIFKNFVYGKSLLFMPLVSSLNSSSCIYSSFTLRSLILCVLPDINKNWVFYNEECTFNKIIKILILISGRKREINTQDLKLLLNLILRLLVAKEKRGEVHLSLREIKFILFLSLKEISEGFL